MSEDKNPVVRYIGTEVEIPDAVLEQGWGIRKEMEGLVRRIDKHQCARVTSMCSLMLNPEADINSYRQLVSLFATIGEGWQRMDTMLKFMLGDVLNQAEDVYGESAYCVYGVELKWSSQTVNNIRYVAKRVPPENRQIGLSFRMHQDLASLAPEDQRYYLGMAYEWQKGGIPDFRHRVLVTMRDEIGRRLLESVKDDKEKVRWQGVVERYNPNPRDLMAMMSGRKNLPMPRPGIHAFTRARLLDVSADIGGRDKVDREEVLEIVLEEIKETALAMKRGQISGRKEDFEKQPWTAKDFCVMGVSRLVSNMEEVRDGEAQE